MSSRAKKFISFYKPYKALFFKDMFCAFLSAAITLVYPMIIRYITGTVLIQYQIDEAMGIIIKLGLVMLAMAILEMACTYYVTAKGHVMGVYMEADMRNEIFDHYQKLSFSFYDNNKTGQLMSRVTSDLFEITELCHHGPEDIVISIIKIIGGFVILVTINWKLTLIAYAMIPLMVLFTTLLRKHMRAASRKSRERIADVNTQLEDNIAGIRVVKSFANEEEEKRKFHSGNGNFVQSKMGFYKQMARFHSGLGFFTSMLTVVTIVFGSVLITGGSVEVSDLLTFMLYINNVIDPVKKLVNFTEQFENGITGFTRFMEVLETEPDITDSPDAKPIEDVKGEICFENVSFKYGGTLSDVFKNINLKVAPGSYTALVGSSGVGKTTMCSLIPRFYEATQGRVLIDGKDVKDITLHSLRKNIGIVQQDVYLFAGTVAENIRYGKLDATDEEIIQAAKNANAHDFIMSLPNGYDTDIGQRGVKLSGGQKQRLSIARVFLKNPPVLIFDEATSSLDNESEKVVQESLEKLARNRTTFVIAHRLSTIKNAENIVVLTEDGIAEQGTHDDLLKNKGVYSALYSANL